MTLYNGDFENGWTTDDTTGNQTPHGWTLVWQNNGAQMLSSGAFPGDDPPVIETVVAVPECVHKTPNELPPHQWPDGEKPLILDGQTCYKVFGHGFSATLSQIVPLVPGSRVTFRVPVQVHHSGDGSYGACAVRAFVGAVEGEWVTFHAGLPDPAEPEWVTLSVECEVHGTVVIGVDIEGRAEADVSFFLDALSLEVEPPEPQECPGAPARGYARTYRLLPLPPKTSKAEAAHVMYWSYFERRTIGFNRHDAGAFGGPDNTVELVNFRDHSAPDWDEAAERAWFAEHYPLTKVVMWWIDGIGGPEPPEPEPEPEPEPPPVYDYPVIETGSKLASHAIGEGGTFDILQYCVSRGVTVPVVKVLAPTPAQLPAVANLKELSPDTLFIARLMRVPGSGVDIEGPQFTMDPQAYMNLFLPSMFQYPEYGYWELWNEQDQPGEAGHVQMAEFACACMDIAAANGIKLALMSYSTGVPEIEEWAAILSQTDFFEKAIEGGHILSLHAYGRTTDHLSLEYHLLRHRRLYDEILIPAGLVVPYVLTEYSINENDHGVGITDWTTEELIAEYANYDQLLAQEYYSLGACIYTFGIGGWEHYNHNEIWGDVAEYIVSVKDRENATE